MQRAYAGSGAQSIAASDDELAGALEIAKDALYFCALRRPDALRISALAAKHICFSIDTTLIYEPFFTDFGPLNMGCTFRFCHILQVSLKEAHAQGKRVYFLCNGADPHLKSNAAVLIGAYSVLYLGTTADDAYRPLLQLKPFAPYRDASCGVSTYHLTVLDCLRGLERARDCGIVDFHKPGSRFNIEEYMHFEQVENGDLNWILPGKFIAFSGPSAKHTEYYGYRTLTPEDYWQPFQRFGVSAVVRLNKKQYDRKRFQDGGFRHYDLYFPDGTCPTEAIIVRFLEIAESEPGAICVHCKAGLGRTGVLIGLYLMKHYGFAANEVLGYMRICRPGMVIGPQQHFMRDWEQRMWKAGETARARVGQAGLGPPTPPALPPASWADEPSASPGGEGVNGARTSPMKAMHSGTRPSFQGAAAGSPYHQAVRGSLDSALTAAGARLPSAAGGTSSVAGAFVGRSVNGLRRSLNSGSGTSLGAYGGIGSAAGRMGDLSVGARGLPLVPSVPSPTNRRGVPPATAADMSQARTSPFSATLHTDTVHASHPASRGMGLGAYNSSSTGLPHRPAALSATINSLLPARGGLAQVSPGGTTRLVTAAGQPRKLPAAAAYSAAYANAYRSGGGKPPSQEGGGAPGGAAGQGVFMGFPSGVGQLRAASSLPAAAAAYGGSRRGLSSVQSRR